MHSAWERRRNTPPESSAARLERRSRRPRVPFHPSAATFTDAGTSCSPVNTGVHAVRKVVSTGERRRSRRRMGLRPRQERRSRARAAIPRTGTRLPVLARRRSRAVHEGPVTGNTGLGNRAWVSRCRASAFARRVRGSGHRQHRPRNRARVSRPRASAFTRPCTRFLSPGTPLPTSVHRGDSAANHPRVFRTGSDPPPPVLASVLS